MSLPKLTQFNGAPAMRSLRLSFVSALVCVVSVITFVMPERDKAQIRRVSRPGPSASSAKPAPRYSSRVLGRHEKAVNAVAFAPDVPVVASGGEDEIILLWNTKTGERRRFVATRGEVVSLAFSPGGTLLAAGLTGYRVSVSPSGPTLPSSNAMLFDVASGEGEELPNAANFSGVEVKVAYSADNKYLALPAADGTIRIWDTRKSSMWTLGEYSLSEWPGQRVTSIAFSPDGQTLAVAIFDEAIELWDMQSRQMRLLGQRTSKPVRFAQWVAFAPDGRSLAVARYDLDGLAIWDTRSGRLQKQLRCNCKIAALAFSPTGSGLAALSGKQVLWWNISSDQKQVLGESESDLTTIAFSPDGRSFVTGSAQGEVRLWQLAGR